MLYGGNTEWLLNEEPRICAAHRCELSIEEHDLLDQYPDLCEKHARIAAMQEEDDYPQCVCCGDEISETQGDLCKSCEQERITAKMVVWAALATYANERAIAQTMPRCGANLPAFIAQLQKVFKARDCAEKARHEYAIKYVFINL